MKTINISARQITNGFILSSSVYDPDDYGNYAVMGDGPKEVFVEDLSNLGAFAQNAVEGIGG